MTAPSRPGAINLVLLCYVLCGPFIGTLLFVCFAAALAWLTGDPTSGAPTSSPLFWLLPGFSLAVPFGFVVGALPAIATGFVSVGVNRISPRWARNPFISGLVGAAMSIPLELAISGACSPVAGGSADYFLWHGVPAIGFLAAFCCNGIVVHFERRAECSGGLNGASRGLAS
jgi:hypothetical protein